SKPPRRQNRLRKATAPSTGKFYSSREPFADNLLDGLPQPHGGEIPFANPSHLANVGSCFGFSGDRPAQVVNQHVVILGAALVIGEDAVEDVQQLARFDLEPGLLQRLAADAVAKLLSQFQHSAWHRPLPLERLGGAAHQQSAAAIHDNGADSDDGLFRVKTFHCAKKSLGLNPTSFQPFAPSFIWKRIWVVRCTPSCASSAGVAAMSISAMANPLSFSEETCS